MLRKIKGRALQHISIFMIISILISTFSMIPQANALGLGAKITENNINADLYVIADYSKNPAIQILTRAVVWFADNYFDDLGISITKEDILQERLIKSIELSDNKLDIKEVNIFLNPGLDETRLRVNFLIENSVELCNSEVLETQNYTEITKTYRANLKWRSFHSKSELGSEYQEAFRDFLIDLALYYFIHAVKNGTLNSIWTLMNNYNKDVLNQIIDEIYSSSTLDFIREKIVAPIETYIREHGAGSLLDIISEISETLYNFTLDLKNNLLVGWLISAIIDNGLELLKNIADYISIILNAAANFSSSLKEFIDKYGDLLFTAGLSLSLIGLHYNLKNAHLNYLSLAIIDIVKFSEKVSYMLDHPDELERVHEIINSPTKLISLVGDFLSSMLLDMSGFFEDFDKWNVTVNNGTYEFYFQIPVYEIPVFGLPLIIDPEERISLPEGAILLSKDKDYVTFQISEKVLPQEYSEDLLYYFMGVTLMVITAALLVIALRKLCLRREKGNHSLWR